MSLEDTFRRLQIEADRLGYELVPKFDSAKSWAEIAGWCAVHPRYAEDTWIGHETMRLSPLRTKDWFEDRGRYSVSHPRFTMVSSEWGIGYREGRPYVVVVEAELQNLARTWTTVTAYCPNAVPHPSFLKYLWDHSDRLVRRKLYEVVTPRYLGVMQSRSIGE